MRLRSATLLLGGCLAAAAAAVLGAAETTAVESAVGETSAAPGVGRIAGLVREFESWVTLHGKRYASLEEKALRFETFVKNALYIEVHNAQPRKTFELEVNKFADLTFEEFHKLKVNGLAPGHAMIDLGEKTTTQLPHAGAALPASVDWRDSGCVTAVKNQGACGSCYAFSAVGAVESAYCLKHNKTSIALSEQQVISCSHGWYTNGCNGGLMQGVFLWAAESGGLCKQQDVPYLAHPSRECPKCTKEVKVTGFHNVPRYNQLALQTAVATIGPISIAIEADQTAFQFYKSGVMTGACGTNLDHGVLLVGYGKDADSGHGYWLIKNSWGPDWGEKGYIRITMESTSPQGNCGILGMASYPVVA